MVPGFSALGLPACWVGLIGALLQVSLACSLFRLYGSGSWVLLPACSLLFYSWVVLLHLPAWVCIPYTNFFLLALNSAVSVHLPGFCLRPDYNIYTYRLDFLIWVFCLDGFWISTAITWIFCLDYLRFSALLHYRFLSALWMHIWIIWVCYMGFLPNKLYMPGSGLVLDFCGFLHSSGYL